MVHQAGDLNDLRVPPANRLEALKGKAQKDSTVFGLTISGAFALNGIMTVCMTSK